MIGINTNIASLNAQRQLDRSSGSISQSLQRLSSGLRINSARDDAAGLSLAAGFSSQIRGLNQAARNASDGISMLQVAEGALVESTNALQRVRELALQAGNGGYGDGEKAQIQAEVDALLSEIDRINQQTSFGSQKLFAGKGGIIADPDKQGVIDGLKLYWLQEAEDRIYQYYGIQASGGPKLEVKLLENGAGGDGTGGTLAFVSSSYSGGQLVSQSLNIDMDDFRPPKLPNGGTAPYFNDRIIAHEMVHAYMARTMNLPALTVETNDSGSGGTVGGWFTEGIAEFIQGADERLQADITAAGGAANLVAELGNDTVRGIYGAGYAAVRYLHDELLKEGVEGGIKGIMTYLAADQSRTLSQAIDAVSTQWNSLAAFETDFTGAAGTAFVSSMNLSNTDTGAIGGLDADGGPTYTAQSVMPNTRSINDDPTTLDILFPTLASLQETSTVGFQVGANGGEQVAVKFSGFGTTNLGIAGLDVRSDPVQAVVSIDNALKYISRSRADMGAAQNRLLSTVANLGNVSENLGAARSRIQDADFAAETVQLTRSSILQQSGIAVLAQANSLPSTVLSLLR